MQYWKRKTKQACIVDADERTRPRLEGAGHTNLIKIISLKKGMNSLNHHSLVHKFIDGSRDLSGPLTGFTQFTLLEEKPPDGFLWSRGDKKTADIQARSFMARLACILEADESTRLRMGNSLPNHHEDHIAGRGTIHYSITIWFINLILCLKL